MSIILESNRLNISSRRNILSSYRNRVTPLTYNFINFTSQDPQYPINNLLLNEKNKNGGWASKRYCTYPQEILIKFSSMVNIRQINILINESKIPKMIEFINCIPIGNKNKFIINNNNISKIIPSDFMYENIGFIKLSENTDSKYKARELRKIYININTEYIKLKIHKNYSNDLNMFCQVGIVSLDFLGSKKEIKKKEKFISDNSENNKISDKNDNIDNNDTIIDNVIDVNLNTDGIAENFIDDKMEKEASDKLKELIEDMNKKKENEEYDKCKCIKDKIDKIRKVALKIYTLEEEKKEYADKNDFDKAKEIKLFIEKIKKSLDFYLSEDTFNKSNENYKKNNNNPFNKNNNDYMSKSQQFNNEEFIEYDEIILPVVMKKIQKQNNNSLNKSCNNSGENSCDSLGEMKEDEPIEKKELEELDNSLRTKYDLLICFIGEDTLRKIFSKYIYYKEEGFDLLKEKVKNIINEQKNTSEANKYIITLIDIIYNFLDDKHPSIVYKCLDIFNNILEAIEEKSRQSKVSYDFTITKKILNKIKEKLNDISKKVRTKAADLYCFMLNTDFCEYNTLLIELIENEVVNHFNKYLISINRKNKYKLVYDNYNYINKHEVKSSKQLIITKMEIFLKVLDKFDEAVKKNKTDKKKFPQNILGDFIIMNINHPKDAVREKTKDVMIKFIAIFGNNILNKMQMILDDKELTKILQDKKELKSAYDDLKKEKEREKEREKEKDKNEKEEKMRASGSGEVLFLTNVNKKFPNKYSPKNKLTPIVRSLNGFKKFRSNKNIINGKRLMHSSSQPKFVISKAKLKPIGKKSTEKILVNSKSQNQLFSIRKKK